MRVSKGFLGCGSTLCVRSQLLMASFPVRSFAIKRHRRKTVKPDLNISAEFGKLVDSYPVNEGIFESIRETENVILVGAEGQVVDPSINVVNALAKAKEEGYDLMLVDPNERVRQKEGEAPKVHLRVVRMLDYSAWQDSKKQALVASKSKMYSEVHKAKEMRFSINITEHDADVKCTKIVSLLEQGYAVHVVLFFAPPIPYDAKLGEEFFGGLLDRIPDDAGTCSAFKHSPKQGEICVDLTPTDGVAKGRTIIEKRQ